MPLPKAPRRKAPTHKLDPDTLFHRLTPAPLPPALRRHGITKLPLAVSVATFLSVVAIIVGTMAAQSMQRDDDMLRADLARTQTALLRRIEQLEDVVSCVRNVGAPATSTSATLPVTITTTQLHDARATVDPLTWNTATATETVEYRDKTRGISMRLPYNPKWGNATYKVAPFEIDNDHLYYGPINLAGSDAGQLHTRRYKLSLLKTRDLDIISKHFPPNMATRTARLNLSAFEIYQVTSIPDVGEGFTEYLGKRFNYQFSEADESGYHAWQPADEKHVLPIIRSLRSI